MTQRFTKQWNDKECFGRIIKRYQMFYRKKKRRRGYSWKWGQKQRIKNLKERGKPGEHVQIDTIIFYRNSSVYYIKTAIDVVTKIAFAYVYKRNSSQISVDFLKKLQYVLPYEIKNIHTDNGSEFLGKFEEELQRQGVKQSFFGIYPKSTWMLVTGVMSHPKPCPRSSRSSQSS